MSRILPDTRLAKIGFFENHNPTWTAHTAEIGTTAAEMTALTAKTVAARDAYNNQQVALQQAKVATAAYYDAVKAMTDAGNDVIKEIKAKAATDGDTVYQTAMIPRPAPPTPMPPPGTPTDFTATLTPDGALNLAWKCANPRGSSGTIYQISRRLGATGSFQLIGAAGDKKWEDATVPAGTAQITYRIQALRTTAAGVPAVFLVTFGAAPDGTGAVTASVVTASPKLAA